MSAAEVVKKKGRPKKAIAETITILAEPVAVKTKEPRVSRKSTTIGKSPNDHPPEPKGFTPAGAQAPKKIEPEPSSAKAIKHTKTRSMKSVAAETAVLASRQVKSPSTQPEPSLILKQATAFVEGEKAGVQSQSKLSRSAKVDVQAPPKEFKAAGTLPALSRLNSTKPAIPSSSPQNKASPFLADFFTEPILAEQPAWSRPKESATVSASLSTSPELSKTGRSALLLSPLDTSAYLTASSLPLDPKSTTQGSPESQVPQEAALTAEPAALSTPSTQPEQLPLKPVTPAKMSANPTRPAAMSTKQPPNASKPPPTPIPIAASLPSRTLPRLPPRLLNASGPSPLKPTETPYEVLKHDPKFKALSRRWTSLIVGIPMLLATSVALYGRWTETAVQRTRITDRETRTINGGI